jgi:hypothetical protein
MLRWISIQQRVQVVLNSRRQYCDCERALGVVRELALRRHTAAAADEETQECRAGRRQHQQYGGGPHRRCSDVSHRSGQHDMTLSNLSRRCPTPRQSGIPGANLLKSRIAIQPPSIEDCERQQRSAEYLPSV